MVFLNHDFWKNIIVFLVISFKNKLLDISGEPIWIPGDPTWGCDPKVEQH